jgi:hypothetical protein
MVYELTHSHEDGNDQDTEQDNAAPASEKALRVFRHMEMLHSRACGPTSFSPRATIRSGVIWQPPTRLMNSRRLMGRT